MLQLADAKVLSNLSTRVQVLLEAAVLYDRGSAAALEPYPPLLIIITGKGPEKARYMDILKSSSFKQVVIRTAWLEAQQYATLLACADLGVSLHTSSSDLDLPMKVSDMLGWCVLSESPPVIASMICEMVG
jgi:beta-1,4-mannosyltransferase